MRQGLAPYRGRTRAHIVRNRLDRARESRCNSRRSRV